MKNKFLLLFPVLFLALPGLTFGDIKFYSGLYLGADWDRPADDGMISAGGDIQLGFEIGDFDYDDFILAFFGNAGIDTGQPNEPNFYYGGMAEIYFGEGNAKLGAALGGGWNTGITALKNNSFPVRDSFYIRAGIPINFSGIIKWSLYYDYYFDTGSRLGIIFHFFPFFEVF
ncbi:MAG: hypothetical protein LBP81_00215 [Treponema sp.]|nr:hypothetical protein [Treponema sp.]